MNIQIYADRQALSHAAAVHAAKALRECIRAHGTARIIAATGASQIEFLEALTAIADIDWSRSRCFISMSMSGWPWPTRPASGATCAID
jgi:glucosamine-6-phosphate deaminase